MNKTEFLNKLKVFCDDEIIETNRHILLRKPTDESIADDIEVITFDDIMDWDFNDAENYCFEAGQITAYKNMIRFLKNNL